MQIKRGSRFPLAVIAAAAVVSFSVKAQNLITDGSFETPVNDPAANGGNTYFYNPAGGAWIFANTSGQIQPPSAFGAPAAPDGAQIAFLQTNLADSHANGNPGVISQSVNFPTAGNYTFSIQQASRENNFVGSYEVQIDGVNVGGTQIASSQAFKTSSFTFKAPAGAHTVSLVSTGSLAGDSTTFLDKASITATALQTAGSFTQRKFTGDLDSGISPAKTYTNAVNFNGPDTTVNGVTFTGSGRTGTGPIGVGYTLTADNNFDGPNGNSLTGTSNDLAKQFFFSGNSPETLTLTGLTPGTTYATSFYSVGFGGQGGRVIDVTDSQGGSITGFDQNAYGGGNGVLLQDTFTATGDTITFTFTPQGDNASFHQYAFTNEIVNSNVPEPASLGLLALSSLSLFARRRRA